MDSRNKTQNSGSVMDVSSNNGEGDSIKIFLRVRPPGSNISENDFAPKILDVNTQKNAIILRTKPEPKIFTYDNVGDADITQEAVFTIVGKKIIESCVAGYNGTIFAYGQTGSGKTFTMLGPPENSDSFQQEQRGVIPRSFEYLFNLIAHQRDMHGSKKQFLCRCSFLEIYQEQIFDLLDPTSQGLNLRENMNKGVFVDGLVEEVIDNPVDAYKVLVTGWLNRRVAATSMNRESSRSHAVFTVTIESKEYEGGIQNIRTSQLNLVDLAGSERQKDTNTGGTRLKEAGSINKSLSVLGNVIMSLVELSNGKKRHVPYRDSKLTFLLRDSLGGNTKTRMVACVHPDSKCFQESLSTLNFARSAKLIKNKAVVNEDFQGNNLKLQNEIRRLKEQLENLQANGPSQSLSLPAEIPEALMNYDSIWKQKFYQAMHFREITECEKKTTEELGTYLQELCNKKDKYIQSTKMIIKFRENNIQNLQNAVQGYQELEKDPLVKSLREEIQELQQQLDHNPIVARLNGENRYLHSELKRLRSQTNINSIGSDESRIAELERIFTKLKLINDISNREAAVPAVPKSPQISVDKHRKEVKGLQDQVEQLKQQVLDVTKQAENKYMKMEVDLFSSRKMITELERMLEAHQLKSRIECNALKNLHCQTLKVMTTPTTPNRSQNQSCSPDRLSLAPSPCTPGDNCLPPVLAEGANNALMEEIQSLTTENGKLKENLDVYEAEKLRLKQKVEKLELYNSQLNVILEKERTEAAEQKNLHKSEVSKLREDVGKANSELSILNDENKDLLIVMRSTDKQMKESKEKYKALQAKQEKEEQALQLRMSSLQMTTKELEEALKELGSAKEELETNRVTVSFLENQSQELQTRLNQEKKDREKVEMDYKNLRGESSMSSQNYAEFKQHAEISLKQKQAELEGVKADQERVIAEQATMLDQNKVAIANLLNELQKSKSKLGQQEEAKAMLSSDCERYVQELRDLKEEADLTSSNLIAAQRELKELRRTTENQMKIKVFEIDNLQQTQESLNNHLLRQEAKIEALHNQLAGKDKLCKELQETVSSYKQKLSTTETPTQGELSEEKMEENRLLKAQMSALEKTNSALLSEKEELQESHANLVNKSAKNKEHVKILENNLCKKEEELKKAQDDQHNAEVNQTTWQEKYREIKKELDASNKEAEVHRLRGLLETQHGEKMELLSRIETETEEKSKLNNESQALKDRIIYLESENSKLIGHNNHQQKIKLMEKKNQEHIELSKKYEKLLEENRCLKAALPQVQGFRTPAKTSLSPSYKTPVMKDVTNKK